MTHVKSGYFNLARDWKGSTSEGMSSSQPIFVFLSPDFEVSLMCVERVRWNDGSAAQVYLTECQDPYLVESPYQEQLAQKMRAKDASGGQYGKYCQVERLDWRYADFINHFLMDGWKIISVEKSQELTRDGDREHTSYVLASDSFLDVPKEYSAKKKEDEAYWARLADKAF